MVGQSEDGKMALAQENLSLDAFFAWENAQPERHEFYHGEVFAMVGVRRRCRAMCSSR